MDQDLTQVASTSRDPMELMEAAQRAAASEAAEDHAQLRRHLLREDFLARLDSDEEYRGTARELRLAGVLKVLSDNRCAASDETLGALCADPMFTSVELRQELLIRLCVPVRPPTAPILAFWKQHFGPEEPYKHVVSDAVADNGTPQAIALHEAELVNPAQDEEDRIAWVQDAYLRNRDNAEIVRSAERLVKGGKLPEELLDALVASMFEYREKWYLACDPPEPPRWPEVRGQARETLIRLGEHVLEHVEVTEETRAGVELRVEALRNA